MQVSAPNPHASTLEQRVGAGRIFILADDLTGACDSGVAFLACGRSVRVVLDTSSFNARDLQQAEAEGHETIWAFTTETRSLSPEHAGERFAASMSALYPASQDALLFKKIDSAARGHLGLEIVEALRSSNAALALVAPAFPKAGRTVQFGVLSIRDCGGQDATVPLHDLFPEVDAKDIDTLPAGTEQHLEQGIAQALANGTRILLCDASTQADLERLAAVALAIRQPILWAGSAGLAHALAGALPVSTSKPTPSSAHRHGRTLLFVGTPHPVTNLQVLHLEREPMMTERAIHRIQCGMTPEQEIIAAFASAPVSALILTGGDTASFVLCSLGASSIVLMGELAAGIPWGYIEGGLADGCVVVTKSGGFGQREALVRAFEFCERRSCEPA